MKIKSPKKTDFFLLLALRQEERLFASARENNENILSHDFFALLTGQMSAPEAQKLTHLRLEYEAKSKDKQKKWREQIEAQIGTDELFIDANIHWSHIVAALTEETSTIRQIVLAGLPSALHVHFDGNSKEPVNEPSIKRKTLEKTIRKSFARRFVGLHDLPVASAFDRLSGAELARLIRQAGIREVALACLRITAVESVASFLRRFLAEDALAIATQMSDLPETGAERLFFAESMVQSALENEANPSAMLDLLGIWLIGILLCSSAPRRINYTAQKLPLEVSPKLFEIIESQCRQTPVARQHEIGTEIERIAETVVKTFQ
ncbi:MAG: hypothetical protein ABJA66_09220 [Actinomycetota bacterium]